MKNWKTSLFGTISAVGVSLLACTHPTVHTIGVVLGVIGSLGLGIFSKDKDVTGGTTPNDTK